MVRFMPSASYQNFELQLGPRTAAGYELAARTPAGEARRTFTLPLAAANPQAPGADWQDAASAQALGAALFQAAFSGDILSLYDASRALARRDGAGVRLRLRILAPELAARPWDLLYDARQGEFIGLSQQTPIVRTVETLAPLQPLAVTPPLRILGLVASPSNVEPLDTARERDLLANAAGRAAENLELAWATSGSWRALQQQLQQGPWHIFHFIGHGYFDEATGESALLLEDEQGRADPRNATEIARLLGDHPTLRLVVLNACEGAHAETQALYASIAEHLARRGLPAVLAMQDVIADTAAAEFTRSFYAALSHGLPVDAASAEARKAMSLAAPYSSGWATPVLFLRSANGALWTHPDQATGGAMNTDKPQPWWEQVSNSIGSWMRATRPGMSSSRWSAPVRAMSRPARTSPRPCTRCSARLRRTTPRRSGRVAPRCWPSWPACRWMRPRLSVRRCASSSCRRNSPAATMRRLTPARSPAWVTGC